MANITDSINTNNINWSKLHIYFFYLFLFSIPFQTRKVFLTQHSFYSGAFTEYATFFIYASDILLILTLFCWLAFSKNRIFSLSPRHNLSAEDFSESRVLLSQSFAKRLRRGEKIKEVLKYKTAKPYKIWLFLFIFIAWLIISTIINNKYLEISAFQTIKFIELFLLLIYIYFNLTNKKTLITSLFVISLAGFLQSLIAIYQFVYQHSLFNLPILAKITGETAISPQISGIAKIVVDGEKMVRAYGTFPHSNVLGGFLICSVIISVYLLLEHKYTILSRYKLDYIQFYNTKFKKSQVQIAISLAWIIIISTQIAALLFTFSRSAWAGFAISMTVLIFLFYIRLFNIVSRETMSAKIININSKIIKKILLPRRSLSAEDCDEKAHNPLQSSAERLQRGESEEKNNKADYNSSIVSRETILNFKGKLNCYLLAIFISFLFIGLFDHYFWTLQQGRLIFWLVLGMLLIDARFKIKNN